MGTNTKSWILDKWYKKLIYCMGLYMLGYIILMSFLVLGVAMGLL